MAIKIKNGKAVSHDTRQKSVIKAENAAKRQTWGIKPVTRIKPNGRAYNRNAEKQAARCYAG